jgi:hypothetical protein
VLNQHKPFFSSFVTKSLRTPARARARWGGEVRVPSTDPRLQALVIALDDADGPVAATWRAVGEAAEELGLRRPCYFTVRELVRTERVRRRARTEVRQAALGIASALVTSRVVDLPIALDAFEHALAKKRLVLDQHKPP